MNPEDALEKLALEVDALRWILGTLLALNPSVAEFVRGSIESGSPPEGYAELVQSRVMEILNSALETTAYRGSAS